jgi:phosphoribosylglycinamide formyltransferase-1
VRDDDDEATLAARVLAAEHVLLPRVVQWYCAGRLVIEGRRVHVKDAAVPEDGKLFSPGG